MMHKIVAEQSRLLLEPAGPDFPYYRDSPPTISTTGWLLILAAVAAGFAALLVPLPITDGIASGWLRVAAFIGLPLVALGLAAPGRWTAIFGRVGFREVRLMFGFALLNILVSFAVGFLVKRFGTVASNQGIADAAGLEGVRLANFFAKTGVQLLGEELLTILPFLAILTLCHARLGLGRGAAVLVAWLLSAIVFGLLHLPTYNWNWVQCLVVIGSARLVLSWAYIWSKNIWVSTGAHVLNDWILIGATIFLPPLVAGLAASPSG